MRRGTPEGYYLWGLSALEYVETAMCAAEFEGKPRTVLDFACGYGRVARMFRAGLPDAAMTVCDLDAKAIEFCARKFDATPVLGHRVAENTQLIGKFDLIWVGSLFSHLAAPRWDGFLQLLSEHLEPGGVLVFTTLGRMQLAEIRSGEFQVAIADPEALAVMFDEQGFGYQDYVPTSGYGIAVARPWWVCRQLLRHPELELVMYTERGWFGRQDAVTCRSVPEYARPAEAQRGGELSAGQWSSRPDGDRARAAVADVGTDAGAPEPPTGAAPSVGS